MNTQTYIVDRDLLADPSRIATWFDQILGDKKIPIKISLIEGGRSNSLFCVERGNRKYALRRPPSVASDPTSHKLEREIKLLNRIKDTGIPHARLIGACPDNSIIGSPFIVMDWIGGFRPRDPMPGIFSTDMNVRREMGESIIDALATLAGVEWERIGLKDFGKPHGFLERQVDRWRIQYDRYANREISEMAVVSQWLKENTPQQHATALIHGDYSFANVMICEEPSRKVVIIDWELATIGDPLLDLGHLLSSWQDQTSGSTWAHYIDWDKGFSSRHEAADRYARKTGYRIDNISFYIVLALYRLAIILEGSYTSWLNGKSTNTHHATFKERVPEMMRQAVNEIERS